jgi:hypothetical protein
MILGITKQSDFGTYVSVHKWLTGKAFWMR